MSLVGEAASTLGGAISSISIGARTTSNGGGVPATARKGSGATSRTSSGAGATGSISSTSCAGSGSGAGGGAAAAGAGAGAAATGAAASSSSVRLALVAEPRDLVQQHAALLARLLEDLARGGLRALADLVGSPKRA